MGIHFDFIQADVDRNGYLTFDEVKRWKVTESEYEQADTDNNELVDRREFVDAFVNFTFSEADKNNDKTLDINELSAILND